MKATNNTDTLFMDIFVELFAIAKVYFEELFKNADPGTYTIKDIYAFIEKNIETTKEGKLTNVNPYFSDRYEKTLEKSPYYSNIDTFNKYTISYLCRVTDNIASIEKGNFKCSFDIIKVFEYLERFKKLSGAKDKLEFTKEVKVKEGQKATSFEIELSKEDIKSLISVKTEKRDIAGRYTENTVHLSLTDSTIYVTNCFVLKAKKVNVKNVLGEIKDILIPFGVLKNIGAGNCNFTVIEGSKEIKVVTCNEAYNIDNDYKFSEFSFELKESSKFSGNYFYRFVDVLKCLDDWNGNLYFDNLLSFETKVVDICFCIYGYDTNKYFDKYSVVESKPDKLTKIKTISTSAISDNCDNQSKNNLDTKNFRVVCGVDGQKIEVREMINLKVLEPEESKTASPVQSGKESSLNDKERDETKQIERDNSIQPKGTKPTVQYTDDMLELVSLDLSSMTYVVNGDMGTAKNIQSIVLYDEIGKIVVFCDDGEKIECQFDGESILQSILKEM